MKVLTAFMVPPITFSPMPLVTGIDSPVTMDSSMALRPSRISPSRGTRSPGRTRSFSPTATCSRLTSSSVPSTLIRLAILGDRQGDWVNL